MRRPDTVLVVRPFLSGRDFNALHHENPALKFDAVSGPGRLCWRTYDAVPAVIGLHNGSYTPDPHWYRHVQYDEERARGYDFVEDLAAPGVLRWDLSAGEAVFIVGADLPEAEATLAPGASAPVLLETIRTTERTRRLHFTSPLERASDAYVVRRGPGGEHHRRLSVVR